MSPISDARVREALIELTQRSLGQTPSEIRPIAAGLGRRRFFRLVLPPAPDRPASLIARVEAPTRAEPDVHGIAPEPSLEPIRSFLARAGLPVPALYGRDEQLGIDLLEDLGSTSLELAASTAARERRVRLYSRACSLVPALQRLGPGPSRIPAFERRLDARLIQTKAQKLLDWTLPWAFGRAARASERRLVEAAFERIGRACEEAPARLAHRDFKAANLHLVDPASDAGRLVMIDFQGAFMAPPEYDLVCLLRDAHVPLPEDEVRLHMDRTRAQLPEPPDPESFEHRFALISVARLAKDVSHYLHAADHHGDPRYLPFVPAALAALAAAGEALRSQRRCARALADLLTELAASIAGDPRLERASLRAAAPSRDQCA